MDRPDPAPVAQALQGILQTGSRWEARGLDPQTGCDCYGLVYYAFALAGILLPPTVEEAEALFTIVPPPYQPWDIALFRVPLVPHARHLGLLMAPGEGFQVSTSTNGLARFSLAQAVWRRLFAHGLRFKEWWVCI